MHAVLNMGTLRGFGSAQVGRGVLKECARTPAHQFLAFVPEGWLPDFSGHANVDLVGTRPGQFHKMYNDQWTARRAVSSRAGGKLFSLTDTGTIGGKFPHLLLVHQPALAAPDRHLDFPLSPAISAKMWLMRRYFQAAIPSVDRFTVQTRYMQEALSERWGIAEERIVVVPSAVPMPTKLVGIWKSDGHSEPYVLYPSSAYAHKNHGVLMEALKSLSRRLPSLRCGLTVERHEAPMLAEQAKRAGVLHMVDWLGGQHVEEVWRLMTKSAAVIVPSKLESFGLVYWEAMAVGAPLVVADRPFAREACGEAALYAPPDDAEAFADAIEALVTDRSLAQAHSRIGARRYREHAWHWRAVVQCYLSLLESL